MAGSSLAGYSCRVMRSPAEAFSSAAALCCFTANSTYPELPAYAKHTPSGASPKVPLNVVIRCLPTCMLKRDEASLGNPAMLKFVIAFPNRSILNSLPSHSPGLIWRAPRSGSNSIFVSLRPIFRSFVAPLASAAAAGANISRP